MAMLTLVGIPLGLGVLLLVLPALWFLGYIVAGARLGTLILHRDDAAQRRPWRQPRSAWCCCSSASSSRSSVGSS